MFCTFFIVFKGKSVVFSWNCTCICMFINEIIILKQCALMFLIILTLSSPSFWSGLFHPWTGHVHCCKQGFQTKLKKQIDKQCRSWWDGSWAISSGFTHFALASFLVCQVARVNPCVLLQDKTTGNSFRMMVICFISPSNLFVIPRWWVIMTGSVQWSAVVMSWIISQARIWTWNLVIEGLKR